MNALKFFYGRNKTNDRPVSSNSHPKLRNIYIRLVKKTSPKKARQAFREADKIALELTEQSKNEPKALLVHINMMIPNVAVYRAMQRYISREEAYKIMYASTRDYSLGIGRMLDKATGLPGMNRVFIKVFAKMTVAIFGEAAGFEQTIYTSSSEEFTMDMTACPYRRWFAQQGCGELCAISCQSDVWCYGNLKRVEFARTQTLGTGGKCCDFAVRIR